MKKRKFEDWEFEQIHKEFGYTRHYRNFALLETWLACQEPITPEEAKRLKALSDRLFYYAETWNEDELKFMFISPLVDLVDFSSEHYKIFTQRPLSAIIGEWQVNGMVDFMIAQGLQTPVHPFFFLHEYKQERKRDNDPLGQLLIEMLVAQQQNENQNPLYGCYVLGRLYFFVVLDGQDYSVSNLLNASDVDNIMTIFRMFRFVKRQIEGYFEGV